MNKQLCENWKGLSASVPGAGHISRGLPCQDASAVITTPRPALIVCDGRGSASCSQEGAQGAVKAFRTQVAVFEPMLASILDDEKPCENQWQMFSRILYRTLMQVKLDLADERNVSEKEYDFTVAFAVVGSQHIGCFQVGDGAIVLRQKGELMTAFLPDKGEFANQTQFLRENGEIKGKFHAELFSAKENSGVAVTSDGPQHLMFQLKEMKPGQIFAQLLDDLHSGSLCWQDIMDYLTKNSWYKDPRGSDDRSLALLVPMIYGKEATAAKEEAAPADGTEEAAPADGTKHQVLIKHKDGVVFHLVAAGVITTILMVVMLIQSTRIFGIEEENRLLKKQISNLQEQLDSLSSGQEEMRGRLEESRVQDLEDSSRFSEEDVKLEPETDPAIDE